MKTKKSKWLAGLLVLVMMLTMMPGMAAAAETADYDDIYFMFGMVSYTESNAPYFGGWENVSDSVAHSYATSGGGSRFDAYYDEETYRYTMTYEQYIDVIDSIFVNHGDMKEYLSETPGYYEQDDSGAYVPVNCYDPETNIVSFMAGGAGDAWAFEVLDAYTAYGNHIYVEGVFVDCNENITDGEAYVDYYPVTLGDGTVVNGRIVAQPRLELQNVNGSLKIESYQNVGFHVVDGVMYKGGKKAYPITIECYEYKPATGESVLSDSAGVYLDSGGGGFSNGIWYGDTIWLDILADRYPNPGAAPDFDILKVTYGATGADDAAYSQLPVVDVTGPDGVQPHHRGDAIQVTAPMTIKIYKQHVHVYDVKWLSDSANHWHVCSECGMKSDAAAHSYGAWTITKEATATADGERAHTCTVCGYTATESIRALGQRPAGVMLEEELDGRILLADEVTDDQRTALTAAVEGEYKSQFDGKTFWMVDVNLIDVATWESVHDEEVTFTICYPSGVTAENYEFAVLHLKEDGSVELADFQTTEDGLKITSTLSPFVIGFSLSDSSNTGETTDPTEQPDPTQPPKDNPNTNIPNTGDEGSPMLWFAVLVLGGACLGVTAVYSRKKKYSE